MRTNLALIFNPFPGLRPFEADEDHLFFGREKEIDDLLRRLRVCRFLSVVGTSGSGKSSLVRSGLIPSLFGGFMVGTNPGWRIAVMRPGENPVRNLALALNASDVLGTAGELHITNSILLEATLQRGTRGLVEAVRQARVMSQDNLLIVVDQFEELFRFRRNIQLENSRNEAIAFVKLLLEAAQQEELPIYVVITMRSDFIGDCMEFPGLPEAVNHGVYLVPRMTRDELRSAITGPVAVGGGSIAQRLVLRLLNDFSDEYDQLPVLQHALMRTWDFWARRTPTTEALDIEDYEAVGTSRGALSMHAEEAYEETGSDEAKRLTERIFKALTDTFSDRRGIRRPTSILDLTGICGASSEDVIRIIEIFRGPTRSFLMPPSNVPLTNESIVDLSHESLMRCWVRLIQWAEQERASAEIYSRLTDASVWFEEGRAGLWRNPELEVGQKWMIQNQPTAAWARRLNLYFPRVMSFLEQSEAEYQRLSLEKKTERQKKLRQVQWAAGVLGTLLVVALFLAYFAWRQTRRAESNLSLAKAAVDESLSSAGREQAREAGDLPQVEEFRKELLDKAQTFYALFAKQNSADLSLRSEEARAHSRLGDIDRLTGRSTEAVDEYTQSIGRFTTLVRQYPARSEFQQALAYSHNWLGETIRGALLRNPAFTLKSASDAEREYSEAIRLQEDLHAAQPAKADYQQELARTYYNRGILRYSQHDREGTQSDFLKSIALLEPLLPASQTASHSSDTPDPIQDLARVYNNQAIVMRNSNQFSQAQITYEKAIALAEQLLKTRPENREFMLELAQYYSNEARMLADTGDSILAEVRSQRAVDLLEKLAAPTPLLSLKMVEVLQLRGQLLQEHDSIAAGSFTDRALDLLQKVDANVPNSRYTYSVLYINIAVNYLELAEDAVKRGDRGRATAIMIRLRDVLPRIAPENRKDLIDPYHNLEKTLANGPARH